MESSVLGDHSDLHNNSN